MIALKKVCTCAGDFHLNDMDLAIEDREYFVILGPSGAGKTVLMECVAGIRKAAKGEIWLDGVNITALAPEERRVGYVPQDYVLFPFLSVRENITFGLRNGKGSREAKRAKVALLADLLGISHLLERDPRALSGGEKQRVALARALAPNPRVLLLDEPLSSLDIQTGKYVRLELRRIHQELGVTTVHITHNHAEAEELADRIAVMSEGRIQQVGKAEEIFFSPDTAAVAGFIGALNILTCDSCRELVPGLVEVTSGGLAIVIPHDAGDLRKIAISPRDVFVSDVLPPGPSVNRYQGTIVGIRAAAATASLEVKVAHHTIRAEMPAELAREMELSIGKEVYVILKLRRLKVLSNQSGAASEQFQWYYQEIL